MNGLLESVPGAVTDLEVSHLDLRYEGHRLRQPRLEQGLLSTIAREGIREPLQGIHNASVPILLDGFKRLRCARQLHLRVVPFVSWGTDEVGGIVRLLRAGRSHALHLLEEARFVDELRSARGLSVAEIAGQLSRSKAWVNLRLGMIAQLTPVVREALFAGDFPVCSYLYTLHAFRRLPEFCAGDLDAFVHALRGKKLSVREIEGLAHGFFRGPPSFRAEILAGNLSLPLRQIEDAPRDPDACSEFERVFLQDLELTARSLLRIITKSRDPRLQSPPFLAQCHLLTSGLLGRATVFTQTLRDLHDRCAKT